VELSAVIALATLFGSAFAAATILPFQSEAVFAAMFYAESAPPLALVIAASLGNTLGAHATWWMGLYIEHFHDRRWFPVGPKELERAQGWWARWGVWSLLLTWAPFGDALALVSGVMRTPFWLFTLIVGFAKTARFVLLWWALTAV
jgi:membrane protein YqaA with SNARE-associated domain